MDTLDRFLIKEFLNYFLLVLLLLTALYIGVDFLSNFWRMNMPVGTTLAYYLFKVPSGLRDFVPVACLMATLLVLSGMSRQNEVLALFAGGIGTFRVASTFIALIATISTFSFLAFDPLVPLFVKKQTQLTSPESQSNSFQAREGVWYRNGNLLYNVGKFDSNTNTMENLNVFLLGSSFHLNKKIFAKKAHYNGTDWVLEDGVTVSYSDPSRFPTSNFFQSMTGIIPEKPSDLKALKVDEDTMQLKELRRYIKRNRAYGLETTAQQVAYHSRVARVFTALVFVLLAFPFAMTPLKHQSMPRSISYCFLIVFLYLLMEKLSISIGKAGHVPPVLAGWSTNLVFLVIALALIIRKR